MRIIAGDFGGRQIHTLAGRQTRPSSDRVREAWASSLTSLAPTGFVGRRVLDAFAGSGALGFEALSRGAASVVFCERDRRAHQIINANLRELGLYGDCRVNLYLADIWAFRSLPRFAQLDPFDLVILDPPYDFAPARLAALLENLETAGRLAHPCLISYERLADGGALLSDGFGQTGLPAASLQLLSSKRYGRTALEYYRLLA